MKSSLRSLTGCISSEGQVSSKSQTHSPKMPPPPIFGVYMIGLFCSQVFGQQPRRRGICSHHRHRRRRRRRRHRHSCRRHSCLRQSCRRRRRCSWSRESSSTQRGHLHRNSFPGSLPGGGSLPAQSGGSLPTESGGSLPTESGASLPTESGGSLLAQPGGVPLPTRPRGRSIPPAAGSARVCALQQSKKKKFRVEGAKKKKDAQIGIATFGRAGGVGGAVARALARECAATVLEGR